MPCFPSFLGLSYSFQTSIYVPTALFFYYLSYWFLRPRSLRKWAPYFIPLLFPWGVNKRVLQGFCLVISFVGSDVICIYILCKSYHIASPISFRFLFLWSCSEATGSDVCYLDFATLCTGFFPFVDGRLFKLVLPIKFCSE